MYFVLKHLIYSLPLGNTKKKMFIALIDHLDGKPLTHMAAIKTVDSRAILAIMVTSTFDS